MVYQRAKGEQDTLPFGTHQAERVQRYQHATVHSFLELLGAAGLTHAGQLEPGHIQRRCADGRIRTYAELHPWEPIPAAFTEPWRRACAERFGPTPRGPCDPPAALPADAAQAQAAARGVAA